MKFKSVGFVIIITFLVVQLTGCKNNNAELELEENDTIATNTIISENGYLRTDGNKIVNKNGNRIVLSGMSLFWSQWGGEYYNADCVKYLKEDWKCNIIRAALGIEGGGYLENKEIEKNKITTVIDACIDEGIYVIIDWHDHHAENHLEEAKSFFGEMAQKYNGNDNIIYEIYNEPLQISWTNVIKPYANEVIAEIRKYDKKI